jgi:pilus assembly protein CpaB
MGKYKSIILLGAGILVALVTSLLTYNWLQSKAEADVNVPLKTIDVAVAAADLNWGDMITKEMVEFKPFLEESLPEGHFAEETPLEGRVVINLIRAGEPVFETSLAPVSIETGGVAAVISPNKRAMAVKVDKVIGVSGFIHPGNRVDVLVTMRGDSRKSSITKTVLESVLVLAAGTKVESAKKGQKPTQVDVITLEVDPIEAEKLAHAATEGKIQLAMRNFIDTEDVLTKGSTRKTLLASYTSHTAKKAKKKTYRARKRFTVEVIKGSDVRKVRF